MWIFATAVFPVLSLLFYRHPRGMLQAAGVLIAIGVGSGMAENKDTPSAWRDWVWRDETERAYGQETLDVLSAFFRLYPDPRGSSALIQNPVTLQAIRELYDQGTPSTAAGIKIGTTILTGQIGRMDPDDRTSVMKQLRELSDQDWEQFREVVRTGRGNISFSGRSIWAGTIMIANSMAVARDALERGKIDQQTFDTLESEVFGALNGQSR